MKAPTPLYMTVRKQRRNVLFRVQHSVGPVGTDTGGRYLKQGSLSGCNEPISWFKKLLQLNYSSF